MYKKNTEGSLLNSEISELVPDQVNLLFHNIFYTFIIGQENNFIGFLTHTPGGILTLHTFCMYH